VGRWIGSEPTRSSALYKRFLTRIPSFLSFFLFLLSSPSPLFSLLRRKNPNPSLLNSTQNLMIHSSKVSPYCSNHEYTVKNHMRPPNWCRSWILVTVSNGLGSCIFDPNLFQNEFVYGFVGLQRLIFVVNLGIFTVFWKILGFYDSEPKLFESVMDLHQLGFVVVHEYEEVSFSIITWFYSEIWFESLEIFWFDSVFADSCWKSGNKPWFFFFFFFSGSESSNSFPLLLKSAPLWSH